ncbi:MAG: 16S rRNA (guanine(527)-N(7))-methyltransferase RsmG [Terriglobales bacterium]
MPPTFAPLLERWLPEYGFHPAPAARARLARYLELIVEGQARLRLVGEITPETLVRRHLGESLYLGQIVPLAAQSLVDVGSGAGFPGLALALGWPELKTTLVESNSKKAAFLRHALTELDLAPRVAVWESFVGRTPPPGPTPLAQAEWVSVRALEHMERLPGWLGRWLPPGARAALWVGAAMVARWRARWPGVASAGLHPLPASRERGILVAERFT